MNDILAQMSLLKRDLLDTLPAKYSDVEIANDRSISQHSVHRGPIFRSELIKQREHP